MYGDLFQSFHATVSSPFHRASRAETEIGFFPTLYGWMLANIRSRTHGYWCRGWVIDGAESVGRQGRQAVTRQAVPDPEAITY